MSVFERIDGVQRLVHFLPVIGKLNGPHPVS